MEREILTGTVIVGQNVVIDLSLSVRSLNVNQEERAGKDGVSFLYISSAKVSRFDSVMIHFIVCLLSIR